MDTLCACSSCTIHILRTDFQASTVGPGLQVGNKPAELIELMIFPFLLVASEGGHPGYLSMWSFGGIEKEAYEHMWWLFILIVTQELNHSGVDNQLVIFLYVYGPLRFFSPAKFTFVSVFFFLGGRLFYLFWFEGVLYSLYTTFFFSNLHILQISFSVYQYVFLLPLCCSFMNRSPFWFSLICN